MFISRKLRPRSLCRDFSFPHRVQEFSSTFGGGLVEGRKRRKLIGLICSSMSELPSGNFNAGRGKRMEKEKISSFMIRLMTMVLNYGRKKEKWERAEEIRVPKRERLNKSMDLKDYELLRKDRHGIHSFMNPPARFSCRVTRPVHPPR